MLKLSEAAELLDKPGDPFPQCISNQCGLGCLGGGPTQLQTPTEMNFFLHLDEQSKYPL